MAKVSPQKQFEREFRSQIERHRPPLVRALSKITSAAPPAVVKVLSFEIFSDWEGFPVNVFAMDDKAPNEVYFKPPFSGVLLKRVSDLVPDGAIDQDKFEDAGVATFETGARILAVWFADWHEAGGEAFPLPAYIGHHDHAALYDLRQEMDQNQRHLAVGRFRERAKPVFSPMEGLERVKQLLDE